MAKSRKAAATSSFCFRRATSGESGSRRRRRDAPTLNGGGAAEDVPDAASLSLLPELLVESASAETGGSRAEGVSTHRGVVSVSVSVSVSVFRRSLSSERVGVAGNVVVRFPKPFDEASVAPRVRFRFRPPPYPPPYPTRHDSREHTSRERSRESLRRDSHRDSRFLQTGFSCPPICAAPRRARARARTSRRSGGGADLGRFAPRALGEFPALLLCIVQRADGALGGEGMNARTAVSAVRTDQEGCQCSGWCCVMERQIFVLVSNLPLGVSSTNEGA